jgi:hypothetical protein
MVEDLSGKFLRYIRIKSFGYHENLYDFLGNVLLY